MYRTPIIASDRILIQASAARVWNFLAEVKDYPRWWPGFLGVRVEPYQGSARGAEILIHPTGARPFRCRVEEIAEQERMRLRYHGGFIEGVGEWTVETVGGATRVTYRLDVEARGWMVSWIGRFLPLHRFHSMPMRRVLGALKREVESTKL